MERRSNTIQMTVWTRMGMGLVMGALAGTAAVELPEGPGKAETQKLCSRCHGMEQTVSLRQGKAGWTETITKMVNLGVTGSDGELAKVLEYLAKNYGRRDGAVEAGGAEAAAPVAAARVVTERKPAAVWPTEGLDIEASKEWRTYGHDGGAMRFSPLRQITPANVGKLKVAWVYHMKPEGYAGAAGGRPASRPGGPVGDEPEAAAQRSRGPQFGSGMRPSQVTPLVIRGVMYITTPYGRVSALDPVTGQEFWSHALPAGVPSTRGLEYWPGDGQTGAQVVFGSSDGKLYSIDARTGKPNPAFGDNGVVNLNTEDIMRGLPGRNMLTSPPTVYKNLVITGGTTQENPPRGPAGDVRAWDMRTGKLVWKFRSIPEPGEKFHETWGGDSWKNRTGVNVWGFLTVDEKRGIVYMPFGAPSVDQYGGDRPGDNLFGTSLVAADANTGKYLWHFQVVHHDIWDADMTGAPLLLDVKQGGKVIPAVAAVNKVGLVFLLNRVTGKPIYGVEERPVPQSEVPLERTAKTQPFPVKPEPLSRMKFEMKDVATVTPEIEAACRALLKDMVVGGPYLPVTYNRLRVQFPGNHGGVNWGGTSFHPELGYLFANVNELGQVAGLQDHDPKKGPAMGSGQGNRVDPGGPYEGFPGGGGRFSVKGPTSQQYPCQQPPWGQLVAVNVNTGEIAWRKTLGVTDSLPEGKRNTGRPGNGGTITTAGGLVFVGATDDERFRAFDARTGEEVWTVKLKGAAEATPMTYEGRDGKQYVVVTATGGGFFNNPVTDDAVIAWRVEE
ncbi:MAG: pyrroloquinoline quinone-dependent dehydrogenase [Bryobacter sp.]|jgi:quinoprotein glucose dehydrogenase|nr:pyrroloquinoline quinone-dependent dehydrogenase [Bryobacter sp. CoA8 C33]